MATAHNLPFPQPSAPAVRPLSLLFAANFRAGATSGIGNHLISLAEALRARGHHVEILWNDSFANSATWGAWSRIAFPYAVAQWIRAQARRGRHFDVVNVHEPAGLWCALWRKWDVTFPGVVVTSHGIEQRAWNLGAAQQQPSWKSRIVYPLTQLQQANYSLRHADRVAVLSSEDAQFAQSELGVPAERIAVLSNGVDERLLDIQWQPSTRPRLLFVGTWIPRKGTEMIARIFRHLREERAALELWAVGTGASEDAVRQSFAPEDRARVTVRPSVSRDELATLLAHDQVFVLPSQFEGMPLSLLEAMAAGLPCVASDSCGMKNLVEQGVTGYLLPSTAAPEWMRALSLLLNSWELRRKLGSAARREARKRTWNRVAAEWEQTFLQAAETRQKRFILRENCWSDQIQPAPQDRLVGDLLKLSKEVEDKSDPCREMEAWAHIGLRGRILDLGCGTGWKARCLERQGNWVVGCDYDHRLLAHAAREGAGSKLLQCDGLRLPMASGSFDWVMAIEVIEHLRLPEVFLEEVHRVLRPGGKLLLTTPNRLQYLRPWRPSLMWKGLRKQVVIEPSHVREYDDRQLESLLAPRFHLVSLGYRGTLVGLKQPIGIESVPEPLRRIWAQGVEIVAEKAA